MSSELHRAAEEACNNEERFTRHYKRTITELLSISDYANKDELDCSNPEEYKIMNEVNHENT